MALPENVPSAVIELDRPRTIAFTLGAMRRIKAETGMSVAELEDLPEDQRFEHFHQLLWAMLVNEDREGLTPGDVEEMLHPGNLEPAVDAFLKLLYSSAPEGAVGNGVPAPQAVKAGKRVRRRG